MKCPGCREALVALEFDGVEVDWCGACKGVWLDRGELELIHTDTKAADDFLSGLKKASAVGHPSRKCPICSKKMIPVESVWDASIVLDECPKKDGIWFDPGELTRVLQTTGAGEDKVKSFLTGIFTQ